MPENPSPFQHAIAAFIEERLAAKLAKLDDDDPKCAALREQHQYLTWLDDAARRVEARRDKSGSFCEISLTG